MVGSAIRGLLGVADTELAAEFAALMAAANLARLGALGLRRATGHGLAGRALMAQKLRRTADSATTLIIRFQRLGASTN